jgi:hypothetical protein
MKLIQQGSAIIVEVEQTVKFKYWTSPRCCVTIVLNENRNKGADSLKPDWFFFLTVPVLNKLLETGKFIRKKRQSHPNSND